MLTLKKNIENIISYNFEYVEYLYNKIKAKNKQRVRVKGKF